jgi:hypothetical protein
MARLSCFHLLGSVVLAAFPSYHGCSTGPIEPADPEGVTVEREAPGLQALLGEGFVVIWTDRELAWGESVVRVGPDGVESELASAGHLWIDLSPAASYRWEGGEETFQAFPTELELSSSLGSWPIVVERGEELGRSVSWSGADLFGLPVALVVERDGEAWLERRCEDGLPCWRDEPTWWSRWEQGEPPPQLEPQWWAELEEPGVTELEIRMELTYGEVGRTLATVHDGAVETGRRVLWGDVHSHSNLSYDGCEDPEDDCLPVGELPGSEMFAVAEEYGLDFLVITDHSESSQYNRSDLGIDLNIHEATLALAQEAEGGPVIPLVGFEWTGVYTVWDPDAGAQVMGGGHRTVVFDALDPCEDYWVGAKQVDTARKDEIGIERYIPRAALYSQPDAMRMYMEQADETCDPVRHLSWFHHPSLDRPRPVNWELDVHWDLGDLVVEMFSEHGSSECFDLSAEGCAWHVDSELFMPSGSIQSALQMGWALGFVGGTDSHDGRPGSMADGPGAIIGSLGDSDEGYHLQFAPGGVTGAIAAGDEPGREDIVDAIELRNTMAASWIFDAVRVAAMGKDGQVYLPGDEVPAEASPLELMVDLEDDAVDSWRIQLVDPWNEIWLDVESDSLKEPVDLAPGEVRYLRIRAFMQGEEHRVWASPFFGVE